VDTGSLLGLKRPRRGGDHTPQLEPRLKKKYIYVFPFWTFVACSKVTLPFYHKPKLWRPRGLHFE